MIPMRKTGFKACIFLLALFILGSSLNVVQVNAITYYIYDVSLGKYIIYPGVLPGYYTTTVRGREVKLKTATITISVQGFPSEFSTPLLVDGQSTGSVQGGGIAKFEIKGDEVHTFQVDSYVEGKGGERFYCTSNSWASQKGKEVEVEKYRRMYIYQPYYYYGWWWGYTYWYIYHPYYQKYTETIIEPFDQSYTFTYQAEYELRVQNKYGESVQQSGWYKRDSIVTLSTPPLIDLSKGERDVFESWNVDGTDIRNNQIQVRMDQPHDATARYTRQFYVDVRSDRGHPQGTGWYVENTQVTISIEEELPQKGFIGSLGGKYVFDGWTGDELSPSATFQVTADRPKTLNATWREDNTVPIIALIVLFSIIVALALFFTRGKLTGRGKVPTPGETLFCYNCSARIPKDSRFCPDCGADQKKRPT